MPGCGEITQRTKAAKSTFIAGQRGLTETLLTEKLREPYSRGPTTSIFLSIIFLSYSAISEYLNQCGNYPASELLNRIWRGIQGSERR
jgi:hypothetical protein